MASFSGHYDAFITDSVGMRSQISDFQDQNSQCDIRKFLADGQYIEDGLISSDYCPSITAHTINPRPVLSSHAAVNGLLYCNESSMESFGLQEITDPITINEEQIAAALYVVERQDYHASHLQEHSQVTTDKNKCIDKPLRYRGKEKRKGYTAPGNIKKIKTDQYVNGSAMRTYVQVSAQKGHEKKSKGRRNKSSQSASTSKDHEQNSNPKFTVIRGDPTELLNNNVKDEPKDETQKDYIHLRARRGQAIDSHSLAERVRREKISERMRVLQDLVPGCNKVTGKTLVLEKIINYVQSLHMQVECLSVKLTSVLARCHFELQMNVRPSREIEHIHGSLMEYKEYTE